MLAEYAGGGSDTNINAQEGGWKGANTMAFDQYHEPTHELPEKTRAFARMILSLIEEARAIDWYERTCSIRWGGRRQEQVTAC